MRSIGFFVLIVNLFWTGCSSAPGGRDRPSTEPPRSGSGDVLIRDAGLVITLDEHLGDGPLGLIEHGDVSIAGGGIAAVGRGSPGRGAGCATHPDIARGIAPSAAEPERLSARLVGLAAAARDMDAGPQVRMPPSVSVARLGPAY